jgi:hypothetical protein
MLCGPRKHLGPHTQSMYQIVPSQLLASFFFVADALIVTV